MPQDIVAVTPSVIDAAVLDVSAGSAEQAAAPVQAEHGRDHNKVTAAQVEADCPRELDEVGKHVTAHHDKARKYQEKADQHYATLGQLLLQARDLCDEGGFNAFRKKYCPDLGKSRVYELLAIGANRKSLGETRAATRERVARHRAKVPEGGNADLILPETDQQGVNRIKITPDTGASGASIDDCVEILSSATSLRNAQEAATREEQVEIIRGAPVDHIVEPMTDTQRAEVLERIVGEQIAQASPVAASDSNAKLLTDLNAVFYWGITQDPAAGAQCLGVIREKLAANNRAPRDICFAFVNESA